MFYADDPETDNLKRWDPFYKLQVGAGLEYLFTDRISMTLHADWNSAFSDRIDDFVGGRRNDFYYNIGLGINYHFGSKKTKLNRNPK